MRHRLQVAEHVHLLRRVVAELLAVRVQPLCLFFQRLFLPREVENILHCPPHGVEYLTLLVLPECILGLAELLPDILHRARSSLLPVRCGLRLHLLQIPRDVLHLLLEPALLQLPGCLLHVGQRHFRGEFLHRRLQPCDLLFQCRRILLQFPLLLRELLHFIRIGL